MSNLPDATHLSPDARRALLAQLLRERAAPVAHPLTQGQQDLWQWYKLVRESQHKEFNVLFAWTVRSPLAVDVLRQAFQVLVDRHAVLRTTFTELDQQPCQRVHRQQPVHFVVGDARSWSPQKLQQQLDASAHEPFDLEHGPLLRVHLFTRGEADPVLLVAVHHIAIDMWSLSILLDELGTLYTALRRDTPPALPPLAHQYTDFVRWHAALLSGPGGERLRDYWRQRLDGAGPVLNLPTNRPRSAGGVYTGACCAFSLDAELTGGLKAIARQEHTTLYAVLMTAFQVLLHRYTRQEDLTVLTLTVGREGADWAGVIGYFINPVPLRSDLGGNPPFRELLGQVHRSLMESLEHQLYPFTLLLQQFPTGPGEPRLTDILFVYQKSHRFGFERVAAAAGAASPMGIPAAGESAAQLVLSDLVLESFPLAWQTDQRFALQLMMVEAGGSLSGVFQYAAELFDAGTIARMAGHLGVLLRGILENPLTPIAHLPLLTAAEQPPAPTASPGSKPLSASLRSRLEEALRKKENR